jgi:hypothetical protein
MHIKGHPKYGLILLAHERGAEDGLCYFQAVRTGWFRRGSLAGALFLYSYGPPLAPFAPERSRWAPKPWTRADVQACIVTYSVSREAMAQAIEVFAATPALRDYWAGLETVGWLSALPEKEHAALRARLMKAHAKNPAAIHEGLSAFEDMDEMLEQDGEEDAGSVTTLACYYEAASFGAVRLERIRSTFTNPDSGGKDDEGKDEEGEEGEEDEDGEGGKYEDADDPDSAVARISFKFRGRKVRLTVPFAEPLEPVREAVNRILAEEGEPRRIFHVPATDSNIGFVFVPPDVHAAARKLGLLPPDSSRLDE